MHGVDHIVYGVPDLAAGVAELERRTGVRAAPGGRHPGRGTHSALLGLGDGSYPEVIARDPAQEPSASLSFGLETLTTAHLRGCAMAAERLEERVEQARAAGYDPGRVCTSWWP